MVARQLLDSKARPNLVLGPMGNGCARVTPVPTPAQRRCPVPTYPTSLGIRASGLYCQITPSKLSTMLRPGSLGHRRLVAGFHAQRERMEAFRSNWNEISTYELRRVVCR